MKKIKTIIILIAILALAFASGCMKEATADSENTPAPPKAVNVMVEKVGTADVDETVMANGITTPIHQVTYSAEMSGRITHLSAKIGDRVKAGQLLARVDTGSMRQQAKQAKASYSLARTTYDRLATLKAENMVSQQQIDEADTQMVGAKVKMATIKNSLSHSVVQCSHDGVVSAKYAEESEFAGPGTRLFTVVDYKTIIVEANLAESQVADIRPGALVTVEVGALNEQFEGKVETLIPTADHASKTFTLRVEVDNPKERILVGMSATVKVRTRVHENVVTIAQSSIVEDKDNRSVFVLSGNMAKKRKIETGISHGDKVVITKGLAPNEQLIVMGHRDLTDGQLVKVAK